MKHKFLLAIIFFLLIVNVLIAQPKITSFSPNSGPAGTLVTVTGTNLGSPTVFSIGGKAAIVTSNSGSQLQALVMPGSVTGAVSITTAGGSFNSSTSFTVAATSYPQSQQGPELQSATSSNQAYEGDAVAVSADGNTAIIGAPQNNNAGAAFIYTRSGGVWTQQGAALQEPGDPLAATPNQFLFFGIAVAISADGNTALIADPSYPNVNTPQGIVYVYTRNSGVWTNTVSIPGTKLGTSVITSSNAGGAVAISADAHTILVSETGDNYDPNDGNSNNTYNQGAVAVYGLNGNTLTQEGILLGTGADPAVTAQGTNLAISADGKTFVESGNAAGAAKETAWVFSKSGSAWQQQGGPLIAAEAVGTNRDYWPVAISADGNNFIVGDALYNNYVGCAWIFTRSGGNWSEQAQLLASGISGQPQLGNAVAMSADGNTIMAGAPGSYNYAGSSVVFARNGTAWGQSKILAGTPVVQIKNDQTYNQGYRLAMSPDGATAIVGAPVYTQGNFYFFVANAATATQTQTITFGSLQNKVYGAPNFNANASSDNSTILITYASSNAAVATVNASGEISITGAGNVTITASQAGNATYISATPVSQSFMVTSAALTATAVNKIWTKGETEPALTANYSGFVYSDKPSSLTVQPNISTTATSSSPLGPYPISISGAVDPNYTISYVPGTLTVAPSKDANLKTLQLAQPYAALTPAIGPGTKNYTASVGNAVSSINVVSATDDPNATLTINGQAVAAGTTTTPETLTVGANTITLVVTAQDNTTMRTYIITVNRAAASNASLSSLQLENPYAALTASTGAGYKNYTASVTNATTTVNVLAVTADATATITVNGGAATSGNPHTVALSVGANPINVLVTAADGTTKKDYIITVTRAPSSNANLAGIQMAHPYAALTAVAGPDDGDYTATVSATTASIDEVAKTADPTAMITINGTTVTSGADSPPIALAEGNTIITTIVTAQDGSTKKTYIITVTRPMALAPIADAVYDPISVTKPAGSFNSDGIMVHQGLSPNGDGINDFLQIDGITNYPDNKLLIMDRNGLLVYEAKGYDNSTRVFDGHSSKNGQMQLPGTYFFSLDYNVRGVAQHKTGFIVLKY